MEAWLLQIDIRSQGYIDKSHEFVSLSVYKNITLQVHPVYIEETGGRTYFTAWYCCTPFFFQEPGWSRRYGE